MKLNENNGSMKATFGLDSRETHEYIQMRLEA